MICSYRGRIVDAALAVVMLVSAHPVRAEGIETFYRGKIVTLIVASDVSGEFTTSARLLARYLGKHIPGNPTIVVQNMPGASGVSGANYLYEVAPRDGTVIGLSSREVALQQASRIPNVRYKVHDFNWLGSMSGSNNLTVVWGATGIKSLDDARKREVVMGAMGRGGTLATYSYVLNAIAATRLKVVLGYVSSQVVDLAMERGEVEGKSSYSWANIKRARPDWVRDHKLNILVQFGLRKEKDLLDVPMMTEFAHSDQERDALDFISSDTVMARPILVPPNAPPDRVAALRKAFDATMADPDFLAEARAGQIDIDPMSGRELQTVIEKTTNAPRDVIDLANRLMLQE